MHVYLMYFTFDYEGHSTRMEEEYSKLLRRNKMFEHDMDISFTVGDVVSFLKQVLNLTQFLVKSTNSSTFHECDCNYDDGLHSGCLHRLENLEDIG